LLGQRMPIAQPFGGISQRQLSSLRHTFVWQASSSQDARYNTFNSVPLQPGMRAVNSFYPN
jgi:hypothetical protein